MAAAEFRGAGNLGDVLSDDALRLASLLGLGEDLAGTSIDDLVRPSQKLSTILLERGKRTYTTLSTVQRTILERRIVARSPQTLSEVAAELSLTRERIRQIQVKVRERIEDELGADVAKFAAVVKDELGSAVRESKVEAFIKGLLIDTESPAGRLTSHVVKASWATRKS